MPREPRDPSLYLVDIAQAAQTVNSWMQARGETWDADDLLRNAVLRQLSIVGEAASCLPLEVREKMPTVPWRRIRGFRNHIVHAYFSIDWEVVREVAQNDLPSMARAVISNLHVDYPDIANKLPRSLFDS